MGILVGFRHDAACQRVGHRATMTGRSMSPLMQASKNSVRLEREMHPRMCGAHEGFGLADEVTPLPLAWVASSKNHLHLVAPLFVEVGETNEWSISRSWQLNRPLAPARRPVFPVETGR